MRLSAANQEVIRARPQRTKLYLSIFQPRTIFQAQINDGSIARGARSITFDSVSSGDYSAIESGFTMLIGTTAGASDIGKIRVRSATSSVITVSENSNIAWADNLYLTVLRYVELWPVYPRIIANPSNESDSIFYKDYDIPYTNQNSILGTYVNAGPHRAASLITGAVSLWYSSTGTYNLLGDSLNYNWSFEGGTPTGSASADPGYITYNTPGHYVTRLMISGSSGGIDTTYRYVSIYNDANPPIQRWEMGSLNGSRDESGYRTSFKVYDNIDIDENAVVVLYSDDWYGSENLSLGGNYPNSSKIFFVGHILQGSIHYDYQYSYVEFSVGSMTELMKQSLGFSVSVESVASPDRWYELLDMDGRRALHHYLRWHTTAMMIADFQFVGDDYKIQFFDADRQSMYDALDNYMRNTLIGQVVSDRQGKVWMEVEAKAYSNPTGSFTSVMDISKRDWMNEPSIEERLSDDMSYLEYGGIAYSGVVTGTFSAILASAPGNAPSFRGKIETHEGLALLGQSQLNTMVGNVWANENSDYPKISMEMTESLRNLDIAPQETNDINIIASDTVRNLAIHGLYIPTSMSWKYDPKNGLLIPDIDYQNLVNGVDGEVIGIPVSVPDAGFETGFSVPGLQIPPLPMLTIPPLFQGTSTGSSCCDFFAALGIGAGVFCDTSTQDLQGVSSCNTPQASEFLVSFDYSSNLQMYDIQLARINLLNTGTMTYYISLEGTIVPQTGDCGSVLVPVLYDASSGFPYSPRPLNSALIQSGCNQSSSQAFQASMSLTDVRMKYPNYIKLHLNNGVCGTCDGDCDVSYTANWQSIKLRICNSP